MRERYKTIYLSPHLDDAVLSCGGRIFLETTAANPVLIVTYMAGQPAPDLPLSPFAQELHQRWELPQNTMLARRVEDAAACEVLGAEFEHCDFLDAIYRTDPATGEQRYPTWKTITTTQHPADEVVIDQLAQQVAQLPPADEILVPLTAGQHVDHRLVRQAAERVFDAERLLYFEDYPYAAKQGAVEAVLSANMEPSQLVLPETAVAAKVEAIWEYISQRSSFFANRADAEAKIRHYAAQVGGERYWRRVVG